MTPTGTLGIYLTRRSRKPVIARIYRVPPHNAHTDAAQIGATQGETA
jgi:hypothetical protein